MSVCCNTLSRMTFPTTIDVWLLSLIRRIISSNTSQAPQGRTYELLYALETNRSSTWSTLASFAPLTHYYKCIVADRSGQVFALRPNTTSRDTFARCHLFPNRGHVTLFFVAIYGELCRTTRESHCKRWNLYYLTITYRPVYNSIMSHNKNYYSTLSYTNSMLVVPELFWNQPKRTFRTTFQEQFCDRAWSYCNSFEQRGGMKLSDKENIQARGSLITY